MKKDDLLYKIGTIANRSNNQCDFLYDLCDKDINKYIQLEGILSRHFAAFIPGDKTTLDKLLSTDFDAAEPLFTKKFYSRTTFLYTRTMESWVMEQIKQLQTDLELLTKSQQDYSTQDYNMMFMRITSQKEILLMAMTGHNNTYNKKK